MRTKMNIFKNIVLFVFLLSTVPYLWAELLYALAPEADYRVLLNLGRFVFILTYLLYPLLVSRFLRPVHRITKLFYAAVLYIALYYGIWAAF